MFTTQNIYGSSNGYTTIGYYDTARYVAGITLARSLRSSGVLATPTIDVPYYDVDAVRAISRMNMSISVELRIHNNNRILRVIVNHCSYQFNISDTEYHAVAGATMNCAENDYGLSSTNDIYLPWLRSDDIQLERLGMYNRIMA
jgi:hypothetical protein